MHHISNNKKNARLKVYFFARMFDNLHNFEKVTDKKIYVLIINFTDKKIYVLIINFIRLEIRKSLYSTRVIRGEIQEINTHLGTIFSHLKGESPP